MEGSEVQVAWLRRGRLEGISTVQKIDLAFRLIGSTVPVDHGYALYSALSRVVPELHNTTSVSVHPIRGVYSGNGDLQLSDSSRLVLRLPDGDIRLYLKLSGKVLDVAGHRLSVGVPEVRRLSPVSRVRARLVTIKGFLEAAELLEAARRQLDNLNVACEPMVGQRRTFRVRDKQVVGFEVVAFGLAPDDSVRLQENGLGGRRKMGCGVFVPSGESPK